MGYNGGLRMGSRFFGFDLIFMAFVLAFGAVKAAALFTESVPAFPFVIKGWHFLLYAAIRVVLEAGFVFLENILGED